MNKTHTTIVVLTSKPKLAWEQNYLCEFGENSSPMQRAKVKFKVTFPRWMAASPEFAQVSLLAGY